MNCPARSLTSSNGALEEAACLSELEKQDKGRQGGVNGACLLEEGPHTMDKEWSGDTQT